MGFFFKTEHAMPTETTAPASLTNAQRDELLERLERDGFAELPFKLPPDLMGRCLAAIDRIAQEDRAKDALTRSVKRQNCVDRDFPSEADLAGKTPEQRWILGEPRPALRWWLPQGDDAQRLARYARHRA